MIAKILPLLNRLIPSDLAKKALEKKAPGFSKFFAGAAGAGYSLDSALDYIRDQFDQIPEEGLRPDQQASMKRVQQGESMGKAISNIPKQALGAATAGAAIGAIPKVIGNLFQDSDQKSSSTKKQPSELSRESLTKQAQEDLQNQNLEQIAPDIANEINFDVSNGITLDDAIENIKGQPQIYGKQISNLERSLRMPFSEIVKQFYGKKKTAQVQNSEQQPQQSNTEGQNIDQTILAALEKILKM